MGETIEISIHAAREGGDLKVALFEPAQILFQSTPPVKAATMPHMMKADKAIISIHAAREGGDCGNV